jgi:hypothetical protein
MPSLEGRLGIASIPWALAVVAFDAADGSFTDEADRLSGGECFSSHGRCEAGTVVTRRAHRWGQ